MQVLRLLDPDLWRVLPRPGLSSRTWRILLHSLVGLTLLALFVRQVNFAEVVTLMMRAAAVPIILALCAYGLDFLLRAMRFWFLLEAVTGTRLPWRAVPGPFIASFGISDLLPLRAGDVFRLIWFQRNMGLPTGKVLGAMLIERFYDLSALLLLGAFLFAAHLGGLLHLVAALGLLSGFLILSWIAAAVADRVPISTGASGRQGWKARLQDGGLAALRSFAILRSPRRQLILLIMSLVCWMLEACLFLGAWISLGGAIGQWAPAMAAFTASTLGTLLPGLPGHFGTFELFGLEMFRIAGVDRDFGAAVLMLAHILLWAPTALYALVWLSMARLRRRSGQAADQSDGALR